jgi:hypothetical protein
VRDQRRCDHHDGSVGREKIPATKSGSDGTRTRDLRRDRCVGTLRPSSFNRVNRVTIRVRARSTRFSRWTIFRLVSPGRFHSVFSADRRIPRADGRNRWLLKAVPPRLRGASAADLVYNESAEPERGGLIDVAAQGTAEQGRVRRFVAANPAMSRQALRTRLPSFSPTWKVVWKDLSPRRRHVTAPAQNPRHGEVPLAESWVTPGPQERILRRRGAQQLLPVGSVTWMRERIA